MPHRSDLIQAAGEGYQPIPADSAIGRFQAADSAKCCWLPDRATGIGARTLLHLIQALSVQGKEAEVRERLRSFKLEELNGIVLTPRERQAIDKLLPESKPPAGREEL